MDQLIYISPHWYRALTLGERSRTIPTEIRLSPRDDRQARLGKERLQRWQTQPHFVTDSVFEQRLASIGIDKEGLIYLLGEPEEGLVQRTPTTPAWLIDLLEAYSQPSLAYTDLAPGEEELGFLELTQPLIDQACERLSIGVKELMDRWPSAPLDPRIIEDIFLMNLPDPLLMRLSRTMVLELNVARLQGNLNGATPEERFMSFVEHLRQVEVSMAILSDYPVLARQIVTCVNQWTEVSLEFLNRLCADWRDIRRLFSPDNDPGILVEVVGGAGDTHRDGRSVMIARFDSGFQIVYKPKSMAVDAHFQELLNWLNDRGCSPSLKPLKILDRDTHGWVEFVEYQECRSINQVRDFYRRLGLYLAVLYAINASDFHLENLIAAGEHPLLIDLETLFNPEFDRFDESDAFLETQRTMVNSVLVAGMLPQRLWSGDDYGGLDISGFGGEAGQLTPDRLPRPEGLGTDEMHFVREQLELAGEANRPRLNGVEISALDHIEDVIGGFRDMYLLLVKHREELLAENGPIDRFAQDEVRVLIRPTRTYDQLLFESFHPDVLHDALERNLLFDRLWLALGGRPYMAQVIAAEQADLQQGDIPVFTTRPASMDLESGSGKIISGFLTKSGMSLARERIERLCDQDLQRQEWFIRSSLATLTPYDFGLSEARKAPYRLAETAPDIGREQLLKSARVIADRLVETAVLGEKDVCWLGLEMLPGARWDISPVGMNLYSGVPGITLYLAYAGAILQEARYTDLARRGLNTIAQHIERFGGELPGIGGFEGWGGTLYALTNLGRLWDDTAVLSQADDVAGIMADFIDQDDVFGVMGGSAGAIAALITFNQRRASSKALDVAMACGDHLLASAQIMERGLGWASPGSSSPPLTGFAHGASGIAWALLMLSEATGKKRYRVAAQQAIAYERVLFKPEVGNWPDLRPRDPVNGGVIANPFPYPVAWCFGAAGIGLSRLYAYRIKPDKELLNEIQIALNITVKQGFGHSHCLCHGDMGNLELLIEASRVLENETWRDEAQRLGSKIVESIGRYGCYCGGPGGVELPGLMLGIAGTGYQMLRLAEPELVPPVLTLSAPGRDLSQLKEKGQGFYTLASY